MSSNVDPVVFKGNENGIVIMIDEAAEYEDIKADMTEKSERIKDFFTDGASKVFFKGKPLMSDEKAELVRIISEKAGLQVSAVDESIDESELEESVEEQIQRAIAKKAARRASSDNVIHDPKTVTKYHVGSLRSGMSIEYGGSVVVVGDVNPGAEIRADGNVIVLGRLKGVVHAGRRGDKDAFVAALLMRAKQLIIADIITSCSEGQDKDLKPEFAYIRDDMIYVDFL